MWSAIAILPLCLAISSAFELKNFNQLDAAKKSPDKKITIRNLNVPAGKTLDLRNLQPGTLVEFLGRVTFGYKEWTGTLIQISGKKIRVEGRPGNLLDAEGHRWWDGQGGHGKKKPIRTMEVILDDSTVNGLNFKNAAVAVFVANYCHNTVISNINIDNAAGVNKDPKKRSFNTDGIGVGFGSNVRVLNTKIINQDDCFVTGAGKDILVDNMECRGGHGVSIGSLGNGAVVENVVIRNVRLFNNMVGVRIKSGLNAKGAIRNITYDNIEFKDTTDYGIVIHGNYPTYGPTKDPTPFPIENITFRNIRGTCKKGATNIWIYVAAGAKNWRWEKINVRGGQRKFPCKGVPPGLNVKCGQ